MTTQQPDVLEQMFGIAPPPPGMVGPLPQLGPAAAASGRGAPSAAMPRTEGGITGGSGDPAMGPPAGGSELGTALPTGGSGVGPPGPSPFAGPSPEQMNAEFWQQHGRSPTGLEIEAITAIPLLQQNLGRLPLKIEVLQYLDSRQMNPQATASSQVMQEAPVDDSVPAGI